MKGSAPASLAWLLAAPPRLLTLLAAPMPPVVQLLRSLCSPPGLGHPAQVTAAHPRGRGAARAAQRDEDVSPGTGSMPVVAGVNQRQWGGGYGRLLRRRPG